MNAWTASISKHVPASTAMCPKPCHKKKRSEHMLSLPTYTSKNLNTQRRMQSVWGGLAKPQTLHPKPRTHDSKTKNLKDFHTNTILQPLNLCDPCPTVQEATRTLWETCSNKKLEKHTYTHFNNLYVYMRRALSCVPGPHIKNKLLGQMIRQLPCHRVPISL